VILIPVQFVHQLHVGSTTDKLTGTDQQKWEWWFLMHLSPTMQKLILKKHIIHVFELYNTKDLFDISQMDYTEYLIQLCIRNNLSIKAVNKI
jgi:hypothetical protein